MDADPLELEWAIIASVLGEPTIVSAVPGLHWRRYGRNSHYAFSVYHSHEGWSYSADPRDGKRVLIDCKDFGAMIKRFSSKSWREANKFPPLESGDG